jgi:hypothetical protein
MKAQGLEGKVIKLASVLVVRLCSSKPVLLQRGDNPILLCLGGRYESQDAICLKASTPNVWLGCIMLPTEEDLMRLLKY